MKTIFAIHLLFLGIPIFSQKPIPNPTLEKGAHPVQSAVGSQQTGSTYAVVVGISDYQNEDIPDLRFADKDAEAFVHYLKSPAGGSLPDERLKVLTNQNATTAQIAAALEWLVEVSQEGDQVIIYFSGHGDVETKSMFQLGYLLTWDSPSKTYVAGAFPLQYLQAMVTTLSVQNKAQVTLITDACRAGKLAGSSVGGAQITNANLSNQFANEVKILSCQPDEFSIEGEQWGGGRGVFSYHLVDGLYGLADNNGDGQVNLFEIGRYLEDKVSTEAAPHSQFPMTAGSKTTLMAQVDKGALASLKEQRSREVPVLAAIDSKGFEEGLLAGIDSVWQQKYEQFVAAVDAGRLLEAPTGQVAAYDLYLELSAVAELQKLHGTMQRNLAAALQDEAQQSINAYLAANPNELAKRYEAESDYERYPRYLRKAAEILGGQNFYYPYIMAKLYYFEGLQIRLDADNKVENATYAKAIEQQLRALEFQEYAPFVLNELGVLHTRLKLTKKAAEYYEKAIEISPEWGLPYSNYSIELFYSGQYEKAIEYGEKALEYLPHFPQMYNFLGWIHANEYEWMSLQNYERLGLELKEGIWFDEANISSLAQIKIKYKRAIELLQRAILIDSSYMLTYKNLGIAYYQIREFQKAEDAFNKAIALDSLHWDSHYNLGRSYQYQNRYDESEKPLRKALQLATYKRDSCEILGAISTIHQRRGEKEKFIEIQEKMRELNPRFMYSYTHQAWAHRTWGEYKEAERLLLEGFAHAEFPLLYSGLGELYTYQLNRWEDAAYFCLKGLEIKPDHKKSMNVLIDLYRKMGQYEKAKQWEQKLIEIIPEDLETYKSAGQHYYRLNQPEKADSLFREYVNQSKDQQRAQRIAWIYQSHGECDLAAQYLREALKIYPEFHGPYRGLGWLYFSCGDVAQAYEWLDEGILKFPDEFDLKGIKAFVTALTDRSDEPGKAFAMLAPIRPDMALIGECLNLMQSKKYGAAAEAYQTIQKDYSDWWVRRMIKVPYVRMLVAKGDLDAAMDILDEGDTWIFNYQLLHGDTSLAPLRKTERFHAFVGKKFPEKIDPADIPTSTVPTPQYFLENCTLLANYYDSQGEAGRANLMYEKAIALQPDTLTNEVRLNLAEAYLRLGQLAEARAICPEEIGTERESDLLKTGKLFYWLEKNEAAEIHFNKYAAVSGSARAMHNVGVFYKNHAVFKPAESFLKLGWEADPTTMNICRSLARLYFFFNKKEQAYQVLEEALRVRPDDLATRGVHCMLSYYDQPEHSKSLFEQSGFLAIWECLELMRNNQFDKADEAWRALQQANTAWWLEFVKYKYLQMKIRQGKNGDALQIFSELLAKDTFVNYQLYKTDKELDPIRELDQFIELMRRYFPEKTNH